MRKNKLFIFFIIVVAIFVIALFIINTLISLQNKENSSHLILKQECTEKLKTTLKDEFKPIEDVLIYSGNDTTKVQRLYDLIEEPCIIYRFSGKMCDECIKFGLRKLIETFPDFEQNTRILIICTDTNPRIKDSYFGKRLFSFKKSEFNLSIERLEIPYLFILDKDKRCKFLFIPDKSFPELTNTYLKTIQQKYF